MAIEMLLVLLITAGAVYLFVTEKFRADLVALMVLGVLVVIGLFQHLVGWIRPEKWITPEEGISGFSNPATITMVFHPGGYRYTDFMRVGIPLNVIFWALAVWFIPKFWPF